MNNGICDICSEVYSHCICPMRPHTDTVAELRAEVERLRAEVGRLTRERDVAREFARTYNEELMRERDGLRAEVERLNALLRIASGQLDYHEERHANEVELLGDEVKRLKVALLHIADMQDNDAATMRSIAAGALR